MHDAQDPFDSEVDPDALRICDSTQVMDGGHGVRFDIVYVDGPGTGFVVRFKGRVYGYLNRCAHVPTELDWEPGRFFDDEGVALVCATHGALYDVTTGACVGGPCRNKALRALDVFERDGAVWWLPDAKVRAPTA